MIYVCNSCNLTKLWRKTIKMKKTSLSSSQRICRSEGRFSGIFVNPWWENINSVVVFGIYPGTCLLNTLLEKKVSGLPRKIIRKWQKLCRNRLQSPQSNHILILNQFPHYNNTFHFNSGWIFSQIASCYDGSSMRSSQVLLWFEFQFFLNMLLNFLSFKTLFIKKGFYALLYFWAVSQVIIFLSIFLLTVS